MDSKNHISTDVFSNMFVQDVYIENNYQKIYICNDKKNGELFLVNVILDKKLFDIVDLDKLEEETEIFHSIKETDQYIYLVTKYPQNTSIKEYVNSNKISISTQFTYASYLMDKLMKLRYLPVYIANSLFNHNNIYIDRYGEICTLGLILFDESYLDVQLTDVFLSVSDILSIIFSGHEVKDNRANKDIPPDIQKIINKSINNDYLKYQDMVSDFKTSKIFKLMNPEVEEGQRVHSIRKNLRSKKRMFKMKRVIAVLCIILLISMPFLIINAISLFNSSKEVNVGGDNVVSVDSPIENFQSTESDEEDSLGDDSIEDGSDSEEDENTIIEKEEIHNYFNAKLIEIGIEDNVGEIDDSKYYKGTSSIKVNNQNATKMDFLVGGIDLNDDYFSYLKEKKAGVSLWLNSDTGQKAFITLKLIKDNKVLSNISEKVFIPQNTWTLYNLDLNMGKGDYIKIYLTTLEAGVVWIDNFDVDILK